MEMTTIQLWDCAKGVYVEVQAKQVQIRNLRVGQKYFVFNGAELRTRPETHTCAMRFDGHVNGLLEFNHPNQVYVPTATARVYSTRYASHRF